MRKSIDDAWMRENGFSDSHLETSLRALAPRMLITASNADTVGETIAAMKEQGISQAPVVGNDGALAGLLSKIDLVEHLTRTLSVVRG